jgi:hypothetical protein
VVVYVGMGWGGVGWGGVGWGGVCVWVWGGAGKGREEGRGGTRVTKCQVPVAAAVSSHAMTVDVLGKANCYVSVNTLAATAVCW